MVNNLETSDDGPYLCDAANSVNTISGVADLTVLYPPRGNDQDNETATEGQTVTLQCTVVQGESSILHWEHEGREMGLGQQPVSQINDVNKERFDRIGMKVILYVCKPANIEEGQTGQNKEM